VGRYRLDEQEQAGHRCRRCYVPGPGSSTTTSMPHSSASGRSTESSLAHSATVRIDAGLNGFISSREQGLPHEVHPNAVRFSLDDDDVFPSDVEGGRSHAATFSSRDDHSVEPPRRRRCRPAHGSELLDQCSADVVPVNEEASASRGDSCRAFCYSDGAGQSRRQLPALVQSGSAVEARGHCWGALSAVGFVAR
jgi:hypothetical protein